ncbi:hypothetical protein PTSG_11006 [Salpingoeca rosetta]|uniref:Ubiquitin-like domain-containing protein n=1 Tax=Salpingoeca rosetta (strain ATCC 50818 / BSB-021) TaxID=946362 RepID=F2USF3_SALR5|nr:uncharacterized protein PTSG_11006 [Salpingoeca rosetta]EGD81062.1 hypothetical protein PTSG_11006 [Salpingoeca rosetta]|eukprot:XP_004987931.1 hypothetical protein PTSG_11006 [Salpingoeca rosetta]
MALFLKVKRGKKSIFLEPNEGDKVQKAIDVIASVFEKDSDDVALVYQGKQLNPDKTFKDQAVTHANSQIVEPLRLQYIFREGGQWQEPEPEEEPVEETSQENSTDPSHASTAPHFPAELVKPPNM